MTTILDDLDAPERKAISIGRFVRLTKAARGRSGPRKVARVTDVLNEMIRVHPALEGLHWWNINDLEVLD